MDLIATALFAQLDDFEKAGLAAGQRWLYRQRKRERSMSLAELATLLMLYKMSSCKNIKTWLLWNRAQLTDWFPNLLSYPQLIKWFGQLDDFIECFLRASLPDPEPKETYAIDSTRMNPHKRKNNPKSFGGWISLGFSHDEAWLGFKLHVVCDLGGTIHNFEITRGLEHDLGPVKRGFLDGLKGRCWADSGYVSGQIKQEMRSKGLQFLAKPTKAMEIESEAFWHYYKKVYKQRQVVEGVFSQLKQTFGLIQHTARSLCAHAYAALAARACAQDLLRVAKNAP